MSGPVAISDIDGVRGFVSFGVDPTALGVPSWDVPTAALVTSMQCSPTSFSHEFMTSQQTLQRRLGRIGRILLEGLLQIDLEQSVGAIILVRVMEVSEDLFEFAEKQRLRIGWHVAIVGKGRDELLRELLA